MKEKTQLGSLIEGGDLVDDAVTHLSQKLRISGKLGKIRQIMTCGWKLNPTHHPSGLPKFGRLG